MRKEYKKSDQEYLTKKILKIPVAKWEVNFRIMVEHRRGREEGFAGTTALDKEELGRLLQGDAREAAIVHKGDKPSKIQEDNELPKKKWMILIYCFGIDNLIFK